MGDLEDIERKIQLTKKSIEKEEKELSSIKDENARTKREILNSEEKIEKKQRELDELKSRESGIYGFFFARRIERRKTDARNEISKLSRKKENLENSIKPTTEKDTRLQTLKDDLKDLRMKETQPGRVWSSYPYALNNEVKSEYLNYLKEMPSTLNCNGISYINLVLLGETGSGKSSFLNTCETALRDTKILGESYKVAPNCDFHSATKTLNLVEFKIGTKTLPVRFHDCPGLTPDDFIGEEVLDMIIDGKVTPNTEIKDVSTLRRDAPNLRRKPGPGNMMHCIIFVIRADSNLDDRMTHSLKILKQIRKKKHTEGGPRAFALVTAIDQVDVPNSDMENVYRYPCVKKICRKVSNVLQIPLTNILPMSNYFEEPFPSIPKNCLALINMWKMFSSGKLYVESLAAKSNAPKGFYD